MPLHDAFFYGASSFLGGVALASATISFADGSARAVFLALAILTGGYILKTARLRHIAIWIGIAACGTAYQISYSNQSEKIPFDRKIEVRGVVLEAERRLESQILTLDNGLRITADRYPEFSYGDLIALEGIVRRPKSPLHKGTVNAYHTPIERIAENKGSPIKAKLLHMREAFEGALKSALPRKEAAFMAGLTVGSTAELPKPFKEELLASGTTHLVALSGANVLGLINVALLALSLVLPRRRTFWPLLTLITLFTIMTGAEPSLVRAAVMSIVFLATERIERLKSFRNAITAAALIMILWNPNLLVFDLGFQLSFVAMLGIAYLEPIIKKWSPWKNEHFMRALGAQVAITPVLALAVGRVTPWAIIPNVMLAPVIPYAMGAGFITGAAALIHPALAFAPALAAQVCLAYAMEVIRLFAFTG